MSSAAVHSVLQEYRDALAEEFGEQLEQVILYGSQARRDAREESDIDVLCVMREPFDYGEMISRSSEVTARLSLRYDVVLSRTFVTRREYETRQLPFLMNIRREGVPV